MKLRPTSVHKSRPEITGGIGSSGASDPMGRFINILPLKNKARMNAQSENARLEANEHRCQVWRAVSTSLAKRRVSVWLLGAEAKTGKHVCYNVSVGGNHAAALFDMVRK